MTISAHAVPSWFRERRYGMFGHMNIATVPAFAPVHEHAAEGCRTDTLVWEST